MLLISNYVANVVGSIHSWKVVMRIAIPDGLKLPNTVHIKQLSEKEILFKVIFFILNFFLILKIN